MGFKIWLYQMVTQVLRPSFSSKSDPAFTLKAYQSLKTSSGTLKPAFSELVKEAIKKRCVLPNSSTRKLCHWVVYEAGKSCLHEGHPQLLWSKDLGQDFPTDADVPKGCVARDPSRA